MNQSNSTTPEYELHHDEDKSWSTIDHSTLIILSLIFTASIAFNAISIVTILVSRVFTPINILIMNLAVADLIYTLGIPMFIAHTFMKSWPFGQIGCRLFICTEFFGIVVGILTVTALSVERYFEVVDKKKRANQLSNSFKNALVITYIILAWLFSSAVTLPFTSGIKLLLVTPSPDSPISSSSFSCDTEWSDQSTRIFFTLKFCLVFLAPAMVITFISVKLLIFLKDWKVTNGKLFNKRHRKLVIKYDMSNNTKNSSLLSVDKSENGSLKVKFQPSENLSSGEKSGAGHHSSEIRQKATFLVLIIVLLFFLQWSPLCIFQLIMLYTQSEIPHVQQINLVVSALSYSNTVANPILYMLLTYRFRTYWNKMLHKRDLNQSHSKLEKHANSREN